MPAPRLATRQCGVTLPVRVERDIVLAIHRRHGDVSMIRKLCLMLGCTLLASTAWADNTAHVGYNIAPLVADQAGVAPNTDPNLVNPWGLCQLNDGAPVWVS